mmetsp:Transcript_29564/g.61802  ORF Transcript_29564/g.61802 Transcript_29564/m.61802 type:complete len:218 (+) Transcript_29564:103-756(+)
MHKVAVFHLFLIIRRITRLFRLLRGQKLKQIWRDIHLHLLRSCWSVNKMGDLVLLLQMRGIIHRVRRLSRGCSIRYRGGNAARKMARVSSDCMDLFCHPTLSLCLLLTSQILTGLILYILLELNHRILLLLSKECLQSMVGILWRRRPRLALGAAKSLNQLGGSVKINVGSSGLLAHRQGRPNHGSLLRVQLVQHIRQLVVCHARVIGKHALRSSLT